MTTLIYLEKKYPRQFVSYGRRKIRIYFNILRYFTILAVDKLGRLRPVTHYNSFWGVFIFLHHFRVLTLVAK